MRRGFTLVELSIVLVIVGLLIGGILIARSMIDTTKITSQIKQLQEFDVALQNFKTNYKCIPGDCKLFGGNGNGQLEDGFNAFPPNRFNGEVGNFFPQLVQSNMLKGSYGSNFNFWVADGSPYPKAGMGSKSNYGIIATMEKGGNIYWSLFLSADVGNASPVMNGIGGGVQKSYLFTSVQSQALDTKIDDGMPAAGDVVSIIDGRCANECIDTRNGYGWPGTLSFNAGGDKNGPCLAGAGGNDPIATDRYDVSQPGEICSLLVKSTAN